MSQKFILATKIMVILFRLFQLFFALCAGAGLMVVYSNINNYDSIILVFTTFSVIIVYGYEQIINFANKKIAAPTKTI